MAMGSKSTPMAMSTWDSSTTIKNMGRAHSTGLTSATKEITIPMSSLMKEIGGEGYLMGGDSTRKPMGIFMKAVSKMGSNMAKAKNVSLTATTTKETTSMGCHRESVSTFGTMAVPIKVDSNRALEVEKGLGTLTTKAKPTKEITFLTKKTDLVAIPG